MASGYYNIDEAALIIPRNGSNTGEGRNYFEEGRNFFADKNYKAAAPLLAKDPSPESSYFAGHAYYLQEKFDSARMKFQTVLDSNNDYVQQATWYLGLTYLQLEMVEESKSQLQNVVADPVSDFAQKAGRLLDELNEKNN